MTNDGGTEGTAPLVDDLPSPRRPVPEGPADPGRPGASVPDPNPAEVRMSASGYERLLTCETKWLLNRASGGDDLAPTEPLQLGTLIHRYVQEWWATGSYETAKGESLAAEPGWTPEYRPPGVFDRADRIMEDYDARYASGRRYWRVLGAEVPFEFPFGVPWRGYVDLLLECVEPHLGPDGTAHEAGDVRVRELKTMGRWGREVRAPWDPQIGLYVFAMRMAGHRVTGADFDAISTAGYAGKPAAYRFRLIGVQWTRERRTALLDALLRASDRALAISQWPHQATKALNDSCTWCSFRATCHGTLGDPA